MHDGCVTQTANYRTGRQDWCKGSKEEGSNVPKKEKEEEEESEE